MLQIHTVEIELKEKLCKYLLHHPLGGILFSMIALPIGVLFAVICCTSILAFPIGLLLGWI